MIGQSWKYVEIHLNEFQNSLETSYSGYLVCAKQ